MPTSLRPDSGRDQERSNAAINLFDFDQKHPCPKFASLLLRVLQIETTKLIKTEGPSMHANLAAKVTKESIPGSDRSPTYKSLRKQLSLYGLNPLEWNLSDRSGCKDSFVLEHREDSAFRINVQTRALKTGFLRVDRLSVVSL